MVWSPWFLSSIKLIRPQVVSFGLLHFPHLLIDNRSVDDTHDIVEVFGEVRSENVESSNAVLFSLFKPLLPFKKHIPSAVEALRVQQRAREVSSAELETLDYHFFRQFIVLHLKEKKSQLAVAIAVHMNKESER